MKKIYLLACILTLVGNAQYGVAQITTASFAAKVDFPATTGISVGYNVALADLDGDGKSEVTLAQNGPVAVFRNTSTVGVINSGSFSATTTDLYTTGGPFQSQNSDLDGDGKKEVVSAGNGSTFHGISAFLNQSTVGNLAFGSEGLYASTTNPYGMQIDDLDGDGKPDVAACYNINGQIVLLRNTSTTGSINFATSPALTGAVNPRKLAIGDIDGDGKKDIVVCNQFSTKITIYQNNSTPGNLSFFPLVDITTPNQPHDVVIADIDGDGHNDIVAVCRFNVDKLIVLRNLMTVPDTITALSIAPYVSFTTGTSPQGVAVGDLDSDGKPDVAVSNHGSNTISVFRNISTPGSFTIASLAAKVDFTAATQPDGIHIGDVDGDGHVDIVVANNNNNNTASFSVFRNLNTATGFEYSPPSVAVSIFPNPASQILTFQFAKAPESHTLLIYDQLGRIIFREETNENLVSVSVESYSEGLYFYSVMDGQNNSVSGKFVVRKRL